MPRPTMSASEDESMTDRATKLKNFLYAVTYNMSLQEKEDFAVRIVLLLLDEEES